ncbi:MAG: ABC transporter permease [Clostridia bacterium]|nr:ABC transporter permease [Clostridia bacterium]
MNKTAVIGKRHEPRFHIAKRDAIPWWKAWIIRIVAVIVALLFSSVVTVLLTDANPVDFFTALVKGAVGTARRSWVLAKDTSLLLLVALAVTPAFKMRFWNIGAEGQVLAGGLATITCMILLGDKLPAPVLYIVMIVASILAGAIWGVIPAVFKAVWNTNETLFTLMMNYIAIQLVGYFCHVWAQPKGSGHIGTVATGQLPVVGNEYLLNIIVVAVLTIVMFIYLRYSKHGYEISVVGESENTARYIGINVKKVIIRTMLISGAICGIAGLLLVAGSEHSITKDTAGGRGFTAIIVSWMGKFNPLYMILTSFLITFLSKGSDRVSQDLGLNKSFSDIITGIIIFFIIGCEFFINYKIIYNSRKEAADR